MTLKSKLRADHRNADLQRRHDALKEEAQHAERALKSSQVHWAAQLQCMLHLSHRNHYTMWSSRYLAVQPSPFPYCLPPLPLKLAAGQLCWPAQQDHFLHLPVMPWLLVQLCPLKVSLTSLSDHFSPLY